ncbi:beta-lactamase family protein [Melanomma pulvis-pyrius CBS 109.77]|uniref:Beta-lactamase family protein n=1 Tax=Melanomma pulvis-pyrius CBS 109.77 TaxID=1314802 RepID=A0A6A6XIT6_9PLEO|nr:beta-lactamase family protein [Melanomma pulvis-pyrius CBS 109.77]
MAPLMTSDAAKRLEAYIDNATNKDSPTLPGAILHIVDAMNNTLFSHASGGTIPISSNSLSLIHSLTKIIGAIGLMQLVERRLASLDDTSIIAKVIPELSSGKVLLGFEVTADGKNKWNFEAQKTAITPRMLMNHTNGTGHSYFNPLMNEYMKEGWEARNEVVDPHRTALESPLMWQPGAHTNYGQGFEWLAVLIERITKKSLAVYFQENIFGPLSLIRTGYEEQYGGDITTQAGNGNAFWPRSFKVPDGTFSDIDPRVLETVERETAFPEGKYHTYSLGTGLVSTASELARLLTILLPENNGVDPVTKTRILTPSSVAEITSAQLPPALRNDSRVVLSAIPSMISPVDLESEHIDPEGSFGLGCGVQGKDRVLEGGAKGRSKGSVYWYGAANTEFWVDSENGVVVFVNGILWNDREWLSFVAGVEGMVYAGLEG